MRIVIDIEGDEVKVHRVLGEALPPSDLLAQAAALGAESAGAALMSGGVTAFAESAAEAEDAGHAAIEPRGPTSPGRPDSKTVPMTPRSRTRPTSKRRSK